MAAGNAYCRHAIWVSAQAAMALRICNIMDTEYDIGHANCRRIGLVRWGHVPRSLWRSRLHCSRVQVLGMPQQADAGQGTLPPSCFQQPQFTNGRRLLGSTLAAGTSGSHVQSAAGTLSSPLICRHWLESASNMALAGLRVCNKLHPIHDT